MVKFCEVLEEPCEEIRIVSTGASEDAGGAIEAILRFEHKIEIPCDQHVRTTLVLKMPMEEAEKAFAVRRGIQMYINQEKVAGRAAKK